MRNIMSRVGSAPAWTTHTLNVALVATSLRALGATFELVSKYSAELQGEIMDWEEGRVFAMGVLPNGPSMSLRKSGERIQFLGMGLKDPSVTMLFKNLDAAVMTFTGQIGAHTASIQRRVIVHGNITHAMQAVRALGIVQKYLLPAVILNKTYKTPPHFTAKDLWLKTKVMAGLGPQLLKTLVR